jgi:hypothetical protein
LGTVLGLLVLLIGSIVLGVALLRAGQVRLPAWLLLTILPGSALLFFLGFANAPANPMLWYAFIWLLLGRFLWAQGVEEARQPAHTH